MKRKRINLALQGGGAHGAFTWGVLDRFLEEDWLDYAAISGTSAGALNGAAFKAGYARGGREGARAELERLWGQVSETVDLRLNRILPAELPGGEAIMRWFDAFTPAAFIEGISRVFSPYDTGPFYINPLASVVEKFHFEDVCAAADPALFVSATNVRTGKIRVFSRDEITADAILASACLPEIFRAVEIDDPKTGKSEAYWDGGFTGNPPLFPLFEPRFPRDVVVISINPLLRDGIPTTPAQIEERINEISFNSSLLRELRAINFVRRLIAEGRFPEGAMKDVLIHMIADDDVMTRLSSKSKILPEWGMLQKLKEAGRAAADAWLEAHADKIGVEASTDLHSLFD
ncbi:MAG: patatin-like phospholipase family protein [Thioclava marina]|uniref:patatin-like phospholipase family protein n=1 Tax=Thioclava TaxID=285107 RepID=UPI0009978B1E|nr:MULTISPECIES: patatin-like phospholipase family protein [Thioclava]MBC7143801.1 patatin-like phospholipase family protein [Thioclava marina]OOY28328.1 patatin [Thioclava sp. L04-15]TNE83785.1 MAG: patatin-like phospholipase family protein [Paracoccaceae bacterium]